MVVFLPALIINLFVSWLWRLPHAMAILCIPMFDPMLKVTPGPFSTRENIPKYAGKVHFFTKQHKKQTPPNRSLEDCFPFQTDGLQNENKRYRTLHSCHEQHKLGETSDTKWVRTSIPINPIKKTPDKHEKKIPGVKPPCFFFCKQATCLQLNGTPPACTVDKNPQ